MKIERISHFRMVRTVTAGESGTLLHAVSEKSGERVAVRLQQGAAATAELAARWQRAVRVSRLLAHPAVVRLIQAGQLADGSVYLIQEQLAGETLAARLAQRPRLAMNELLRLGRQIATVLVAAHARGIIHRALGPESLQLVPDPEAIGGERVRITDWGLASVPPEPAAPDTPSVSPDGHESLALPGRVSPPVAAASPVRSATPAPFGADPGALPGPAAKAAAAELLLRRTTPFPFGADPGALPGPAAKVAAAELLLRRTTPFPFGADPGALTGPAAKAAAAASPVQRATPAPFGTEPGALPGAAPPATAVSPVRRPTPAPFAAEPDPDSTQPFDLNQVAPAVFAYPTPAPPVPLDAPTYLAPEQCRSAAESDAADSAAVPDRVDVYALGVLLFQMAAGQLPFSGRAPSEIIAMHIAALPPKLEQRGVTTPVGLGPLVAAMLIKDPSARPTMREVEERLQGLAQQQQLAQTMTPATRVSPQELAQALPSTQVTMQMPVPADPDAARAPRKSVWVLTGVLGVAAIVGLWQALRTDLIPAPPTRAGAADSSTAAPAAGVRGQPVAAPPGLPAAPAARTLPAAPPSAATIPAASKAVMPAAVPATSAVATSAAPKSVVTTAAVTTSAAPKSAVATSAAPTSAVPKSAVATSAAPKSAAATAITPIAAPPTATTPAAAPSTPATRPAPPSGAAVRSGVPPLRELRVGAIKAPVRPQPPKKPAPSKAPRTGETAAQVREKLLAAQIALDSRNYPEAIAATTELLAQEPESAALILGRAACAADDLTLVNRAYANLRQRPAALATLATECKKHSIELGVSDQFVRTKLR